MLNDQPETGVTAVTETAKRSPRNFLWLFIHCLVYLPFRFWCRTHVIGREHIADNMGGIMLVNHQSYLDPLFVAVRLTRAVSYLARDSLFRVPVLGWICRSTYVIPISRTAFRGGSIRTAMDRLEQGFLVSIYPEGTRSGGVPKTFRPGFLSLVRRANVPVYPVAIVGADKVMPKGAWFIRPAKVTIIYGEPLSEDDIAKLKSETDDKLLAEFIQSKVTDLYMSVAAPVVNKESGLNSKFDS
jgi:1-acyl-sn-glycerol-3-phosphate acyltransferase